MADNNNYKNSRAAQKLDKPCQRDSRTIWVYSTRGGLSIKIFNRCHFPAKSMSNKCSCVLGIMYIACYSGAFELIG